MEFQWVNDETNHRVGVNLETGMFYINGQVLHSSQGDVGSLTSHPHLKYRLIYATRHIMPNGVDSPEGHLYLVGWQSNDLDGKNIKRILYVYPNGEVMFGGEG